MQGLLRTAPPLAQLVCPFFMQPALRALRTALPCPALLTKVRLSNVLLLVDHTAPLAGDTAPPGLVQRRVVLDEDDRILVFGSHH